MKKNLLYIMLSLFILHGCKTMAPSSVPSVNAVVVGLNADVLGNIYICLSGNTINKYVSGNLKFTQNIKIYGTLTSMDVSNPMEIYIFFRDAAQVVFMDNTLSFRGSMDLSGKGIITCMCRSFDNGIWLFDQADMQLKKADKSGNILQSAGNAAITGAKQLNPFMMQDDGNYIYLADSLTGIYIYDLNANFVRRIPAPGVSAFYAENKIVRYIATGLVYEFDMKNGMGKTIGKTNKKGCLVKNRYYWDCTDSVYCVTTF